MQIRMWVIGSCDTHVPPRWLRSAVPGGLGGSGVLIQTKCLLLEQFILSFEGSSPAPLFFSLSNAVG